MIFRIKAELQGSCSSEDVVRVGHSEGVCTTRELVAADTACGQIGILI